MKNFDNNEFSYEQVIAAYDVLQVELCANCDTVVKKSYYKLARKHHPDKNKENKDTEETFKCINNAYQYLQNFKKTIEDNKTDILKAACKDLQSQTTKLQPRQHTEHAYEKQAQTKEDPLETVRRRENEAILNAKQEVEILRFVFEHISIPNYLNVLQTQQYLIRECSKHLLSEAFELNENVLRILDQLKEIKQQISLEIVKLNSYVSYIFFLDDENDKRKKLEVLNFYLNQLDCDFYYLKMLKIDFDFAFRSLKTDKSFSSVMDLNLQIDLLNTEIANAQLKYYYYADFSEHDSMLCCKLSRELNLKYITRITEEFIHSNEKFSSYFTSICQQNLFEISKTIVNWKNIEKIKITNSPYIGFPAFLVKMSNLKEINLEGNHITSLPENIGDVYQVNVLNLNNNCLSFVPRSFANLNNLSYLILSNNKFSYIPNEISKLTQLKELNFANLTDMQNSLNTIRDISETLKGLVNLEKLFLSGNKISYLPESVVSSWSKLEVLHLDNNLLTTLPNNIGDMTSLKFVSAINNLITFIPSSILKLKGKLKNCFLDNNLLHHHAIPVIAVLNLMGTTPDKLLSTQSYIEQSPMDVDNVFSFYDDDNLLKLTWEYVNFLNVSKNVNATQFHFNMNYFPSKVEFRQGGK